jgi:hypothetical protein
MSVASQKPAGKAGKPAQPAEPLPDLLPRFGRTPEDPDDPILPQGEVGIRIATAGLEGPPDRRRWPLRGAFRVPLALAGEGASPEAVLQRIVLVLTCGSSHDVQARHAFRDELLFAEDVTAQDGIVEGAFHLDLLRTFAFVSDSDTYFILASVGGHLSPVVRCPVEMPWLTPTHEQIQAVADAGDGSDDDGDDDPGADDGDKGWEIDDPE